MKKCVSLLAALIVLSIPVIGADINLQSPLDGSRIDPYKNMFSFSTASDAMIDQCHFIFNGEIFKTVIFKDNIKGRSFSYFLNLEDGDYSWSIECDTFDKGLLTSGTRSVTVEAPTAQNVTVTSSGIFRGSLLHSFTIRNRADQRPITIRKVAPGDVIKITIDIPPSKVSKEFYVKGRTIKNGTNALRLSSDNIEYILLEGEKTLMDVGSAKGLVEFSSIETNRFTLIAYPNIPENITEEEIEEYVEEIEEPESEEEELEPEVIPTPPEVPPQPAPPQKQGFFKGLISWLVSLFGK